MWELSTRVCSVRGWQTGDRFSTFNVAHQIRLTPEMAMLRLLQTSMYTSTVQDLHNVSQRWRGWSESLQTQAVHRSYRKSAFEAASEHHRRAKAVAMLAVSFCGLSSMQERVDAKRAKKQEEFWCTDFQALRRLPKPSRIETCAPEVHVRLSHASAVLGEN